MGGEVLTKAEQVEEEFLKLYDEFHVFDAPEKRKADIIDSLWSDIYKAVFKPEQGEKLYNNTKSKFKTYDVMEVEEVCDMYIKLCRRYGGVLKKDSFCELTGIHRATYSLWNNRNKTDGFIFKLNDDDIREENKSIIYIFNNNNVDVVYNGNSKYTRSNNTKELSSMRFDVWKKIEYAISGENTNDLRNSPNGSAIRANWDVDVKKGYGRQAYMEKAEVIATLAERKLPRIGGGNCAETANNLLIDSNDISV